MTRQEYEKICRAVYGGEEFVVENVTLHEKARVFNCKSDTFNVRVGSQWRQWGRQVCEETAGEQGRRRK